MLTGLVRRARALLDQEVHGDATSVARALVMTASTGTLLANPPRLLLVPVTGPADDNLALTQWHGQACGRLVGMTAHCLVPAGVQQIGQWVMVAVLVVAAVGWRPRWTAAPAAWIVCSTAMAMSRYVGDGGDRILGIFAVLLVPVGFADRRRWAWRRAGPTPPAHPVLRLLARLAIGLATLQVTVIYAYSTIAKLRQPVWWRGTALYYIAQDPSEAFGSRGARLLPLLELQPLMAAVLWATMAIEGALALGVVLPRRRRRWLLPPGIVLHLAIGALLGLVSFTLAMVAGLILYGWPLGPRRAARQQVAPGEAREAVVATGQPPVEVRG